MPVLELRLPGNQCVYILPRLVLNVLDPVHIDHNARFKVCQLYNVYRLVVPIGFKGMLGHSHLPCGPLGEGGRLLRHSIDLDLAIEGRDDKIS